ncbi:IclR family transcriptional regulator [Taklimakanibacter deserti]|uniref:IclR family transcriptional regulator n=1 Tax=Taklimakanibacter deserti TaxID=2267839 RepID=UPI000E651152
MNQHDPEISAAAAVGDLNDVASAPGRNHGGIQSVDIGMTVLRALAQAKGPMSLKEIGAACAMAPSKAHRYLHSLVAGGLVAQQRRSGKYDLGMFALRLGASAIRRIDVVNRVSDHLEDLVDQLQMPAHIAIWTHEGPIAVRWQRTPSSLISPDVLGSVFPLLRSATGNVFLSHLPERMTHSLVAAEIQKESELENPIDVDVAEITRKVREQGYAMAVGTFVPHYVGLAAPVINWDDEICAAVTIVARTARDPQQRLAAAAHLRTFCKNMSAATR